MTLYITELPPLYSFECVSVKAAAAVVEQSAKLPTPGVYGEHRARAKGKQVTVMYTDPFYLADLATWAYQRGHTTDLAYPRANL